MTGVDNFSQVARSAFAAMGLGLLIVAVPYGLLTDTPVPVGAVVGLGVVSLAVWLVMARQAR